MCIVSGTKTTEVTCNIFKNQIADCLNFVCILHVLIFFSPNVVYVVQCVCMSQNIKAHENRRQIFSKTAARENPFQHQPKPATEPPPWSNSSNASENLQETSG